MDTYDAMAAQLAYGKLEALTNRLLNENNELQAEIERLLGLLKSIEEHEHLAFAEVPWPDLDGDPESVESVLRATKFKDGHVDGHRCCAAIARKGREK